MNAERNRRPFGRGVAAMVGEQVRRTDFHLYFETTR